MKKLLLLFSIVLISPAESQVAFAPAGAEWHYVFHNESTHDFKIDMAYVGDSLLSNGETAKKIHYGAFFKLLSGNACSEALLKQKGDTIFVKNCNTIGSWQILYNFAATAGQQWITTVKDSVSSNGTSGPLSYTTQVLSVSAVTLNNMSLKKLRVTYKYPSPFFTGTTQVDSNDVLERIGCTRYLFNFFGKPNYTDPSVLTDFLCYKDNSIGTVEGFSSKGCNYAVGIAENKTALTRIKLYPQPVGNLLNIECGNTASKNYEVRITDVVGHQVMRENIQSQQNTVQLDVSALSKGIYMVQLYENSTLLDTGKIIKE